MALSQYLKVCAESSGGGKTLHLIAAPDLTSFTLGTTPDDDKFISYTIAGTADFVKYEFKQDTFAMEETVTGNQSNVTSVQKITFLIENMNAEERAALQGIIEATACGIVAIGEDNEGVKKVFGYGTKQGLERPLRLETATGTTGALLTDVNGRTIVLSNLTNEIARVYTGTIPSA